MVNVSFEVNTISGIEKEMFVKLDAPVPPSAQVKKE